jgi:hypothetical protein
MAPKCPIEKERGSIEKERGSFRSPVETLSNVLE